jgi:hypothetical protein
LNISVDGTIENSAIDGADLKALLEAGGDVVLNNDVEIYGQSICISKDIKASLDLNGHTLYGSNLYANRINVQDGEFTLKDSSSSQTGRFISTIARNSGLIYVGDPNNIYNSKVGGKVIVEGGTIDASISNGSTLSCGVVLGGAGEIEVSGGRIIASNFAVSGNGYNNDGYGDGASYTAAKTTLKFSGGHLESTNDYALYLPQKAETTISGLTEIVGYTGAIAIQSGKLTIDGGTIIANGNGTAVVPESGDGTHGLYYAAVCEAAGYANTDVVINGGHFISYGTASDFNNLYKGEKAKYDQTTTVNGGAFSDLTLLPYFKTGSTEKITLLKDWSDVSDIAYIDSNVVLDLNGHSITSADAMTKVLASSDGLVIVRRGAKLTIDDSVGGGSITSKVACAVKLTEKDDDRIGNAVLYVKNAIITGVSYAIVGNGTRHGTDITIDKGTFTSSNPSGGSALYHPQDGTLTINGGTFKGYQSGVELRSGTLTINDGTFESTADIFKTIHNNNGTTTTGAGLVIAQHTTGKVIKATIKGGLYKSASSIYTNDNTSESKTGDGYAFCVIKQQNHSTTSDHGKVTVSVEGGTFEKAIYSDEETQAMVKGGKFKVAPVSDYLVSGYSVSSTANSDGYYTISANE